MTARIRRSPLIVLAGLAGFAAGAVVVATVQPSGARAQAPADGHKPDAGVKAPLAEVMHCPLAFAGVHLMKEFPEVSRVAYHYCKPVNDDVAQCVLYDGTGPDARLIGAEYLVSAALYDKMPAEEKVYWHDHKYEVDAGLLKSLTQTGADEKATLAKVRTLYGKVFHNWAAGKVYPEGPPRLFWSVTGEEPFTLPQGARLPAEMKAGAK